MRNHKPFVLQLPHGFAEPPLSTEEVPSGFAVCHRNWFIQQAHGRTFQISEECSHHEKLSQGSTRSPHTESTDRHAQPLLSRCRRAVATHTNEHRAVGTLAQPFRYLCRQERLAGLAQPLDDGHICRATHSAALPTPKVPREASYLENTTF